MRVAIVGHGPSLLQEEMGEIIDGHDIVVRLKDCTETLRHPRNYGRKTDVIAGAVTIAGKLREIDAPEAWLFYDSRHENLDQETDNIARRVLKPRNIRADKGLCDEWDEKYREVREQLGSIEQHPQMKPSRYGDELGEKHLSQGFKAVLYAASMLRPEQITLAGFDNVATGDFSWSITRGPDWTGYPEHRWDVENKMLPMVEEAYGVEIGFLLPTNEELPDEE